MKSALKNKEYVSDITWLFDCYDDIYLDCCHVTEKGNEIIAEYNSGNTERIDNYIKKL